MSTFTQANRPLEIKTALGADALLLAGFEGEDAISQLFEYRVQMYAENGSIDASRVLRNSVTITIASQDGSTRYINGIFRDFVQGGYDETSGLYSYEATLVPKIWLLSLAWNCRIFQNKSVPQIIEQVLQDRGVSEYKLSLTASYSPREYCVQYRESDLNFICRLLESEGISFYFAHEDGKHTLAITDQTPTAPACMGNEVPYSIASSDGVTATARVFRWSRTDRLCSPKLALSDYYFETPSVSLLSSTTAKSSSGSEERYDYPGCYTKRDDGDKYSKVRIEEQETFAQVVRGDSNCAEFASGFQFRLSDHYRADMNGAYLLTRVRHECSAPHYAGSDGTEGFVHRNKFEAIPLKVPYRPARSTRKPVISGSQTAVVVGPSGEEIYVDKYGRVKVQFFWDRDGKKDENSSCWMRVSQIWAGKNWGWMTIPRIGQEVVVDFMEGDPDRPLIVGRVYNAEQMPPYTLPDNSTQSGIKTRSSKGGGTENFNEIRFEDKKGSEELYVHAEKDMTTEVEHDDSQSVGNNRTITVKGTHTETITKDTSITIQEGNHSLTLNQGDQSIKLDEGSQSTEISMGNQSTKISMGDQSTTVSLGSASHEAMQQIELKVGPSSIVLTQEGITIKGLTISIEGTIQLEAKALLTTVSADTLLTVKGAMTMIN